MKRKCNTDAKYEVIGPFEILKQMGREAYKLSLPPNLQQVHSIIHVSMLRKYNPETSPVIENEMVKIQPDLSHVKQSSEVMDWKKQLLGDKTMSLVRVGWRNQKVEESTWELKNTMQESYPQLFSW